MKLLDPLKMGKLSLPNRIIMAPLTRLRASQPGAIPNVLNATYYAQRASAGLLIAEATPISEAARGYYGAPGIFTDKQVEGWRLVVERVHQAGGRIFLQLWHVGAISHPEFQPGKKAPPAPSVIEPGGEAITEKGRLPRVASRAMTVEEIDKTLKDYVRATQYARMAGFDGVEVHGANGYLINQFLLSGTNHRTDQYGGSIWNRVRFLKEVVEAVVGSWKAEKVGVRLSPGTSGGPFQDSNRYELYREAVSALSQMPLAYLHFVEPRTYDGESPALQEEIASYQFRSFMHPSTKLISSAGHTKESGEEFIHEGKADAIAYGRIYISNPDLVNRFRLGAALNPYDSDTFYGGGAKGYTDYPSLNT